MVPPGVLLYPPCFRDFDDPKPHDLASSTTPEGWLGHLVEAVIISFIVPPDSTRDDIRKLNADTLVRRLKKNALD